MIAGPAEGGEAGGDDDGDGDDGGDDGEGGGKLTKAQKKKLKAKEKKAAAGDDEEGGKKGKKDEEKKERPRGVHTDEKLISAQMFDRAVWLALRGDFIRYKAKLGSGDRMSELIETAKDYGVVE